MAGSVGARTALRERLVDSAAMALTATTVYLLYGTQGPLDRDLGAFVYGGEQVAAGVPPYVGMFNSVGPLADALPGLAIRVCWWADPVQAARWWYLAIAVACVVLVGWLGRDVLGSRLAGYVSAAMFLTFHEFLRLAASGPREKTAMVCFLAVALLCAHHRRWAWAGVATGLATLTWQPVLLVAAVAAAVAIARSPEPRGRAARNYLLGGLVPSLATLAAFAAAGALRPAVDGFVVINVLDTRQISMVTAPAHAMRTMVDGYGWSLFVLLGGLAGLVVRAVTSRRDGEVMLAYAAGAALLWCLVAFNGAPDLFPLLPMAAVGAAAAVVAAGARLPRRAGRAVVLGAVLAAVLGASLDALASRNDALAAQRADVAAVLGAAPPGAEVLAIDAPPVLALAGRTNPTPWLIVSGAQTRWFERNWPGGLAGYAAWISETAPDVIATGGNWPSAEVRREIERDYVRIGAHTDWTWWVRRSVDPRTIAAMRRAHLAVAGSTA